MVAPPSPLQQIISSEFEEKDVTVYVKRDDLLHPKIMGNKWRKLKYNLAEAKKLEHKTLLTFGGAYSNHIAATAAAAKEFGFESIGIIRGEELDQDSNHTLHEASKDGMQLHFVSRTLFREIKEDLTYIKEKFPEAYILPEGGTNALAMKGASEIVDEINIEYDYLMCAIGTGGTMAGILSALPEDKTLIGVSSLKGKFIHQAFHDLFVENFQKKNNYQIMDDYHFGGYGKTNDTLLDFLNDFKTTHRIQLDPIYTGKLFFAFKDLLNQGFFPKKSRIVLLHTGGLQGIIGFNNKHGKILL
jgi:1-aminocyclopropane-1-carboxylate deaminase